MWCIVRENRKKVVVSRACRARLGL